MFKLISLLLAAVVVSYNGSSITSALGKEETTDDLTLNVTGDGNVKKISLDGYHAFDFKNVSITGEVTLDDDGNIVSFRDVVIKGAPVKIKTAVGYIKDNKVDVVLKGKAAGVFNFEITYKANKL